MVQFALMLAIVLAATGGAPRAARAQVGDLDPFVVVGNTAVRIGGSDVSSPDGDVASNGRVRLGSRVALGGSVRGDRVTARGGVSIAADLHANAFTTHGTPAPTVGGQVHSSVSLPVVTLPSPPTVRPPTQPGIVVEREFRSVVPGSYASLEVTDASILLFDGEYDFGELSVTGPATQFVCAYFATCTLRVASRLVLTGAVIGRGNDYQSGRLVVEFAGTRAVWVGRSGARVEAEITAPRAPLRLKGSRRIPATFSGRFVADRVSVAAGAVVRRSSHLCGNGRIDLAEEECDGAADAWCPGRCLASCVCPPGTPPRLHSIGPSVLSNATKFGVQLSGARFEPGAELELSDETSGTVIETLPTHFVSATELTALVPAGMPVPNGIERELAARVINPGGARSTPPDIGHCTTDSTSASPACARDVDCEPGSGPCITGDQRLTMFNDAVFLNPNSAALVPLPFGVCADGRACTGAAGCAGIGTGACAQKLYVTPQQRDELWVLDTSTQQFVDEDPVLPGIQGIPVGDNPFHVELLTTGGPVRAWVVNRFDDSVSIVDPATDTEIVRVTGAMLGVPGRLRMETEIEFNRAGTRAYLSNENLDEVQVLDVAGARRDAPALLATIDVGVNPRGMATNAADTRLYVANVQSADVSVVDIAPGSPTENQVLRTVAARATDDIVGGRADGWEPFVIGGRAPRGIAVSDALGLTFVSSIGPQTGPRAGVNLTGGSIVNPTITVIDQATETILAHVALNGRDRDLPTCTDPELMAVDDARGRLYVTCQGSGVVDVLDTAALAAGLPAEVAQVPLALPTDDVVPTLPLGATGPLGAKVCAAFTGNAGSACTTDADCGFCPARQSGIPVVCCATNNPVGLHNGPRGLALSADGSALFVVNQFTTSVTRLVAGDPPAKPLVEAATRAFPGAFGSDAAQRDRRLGQIEFFTDVKKTNTSCATCHIDDHQDGVFFEADVAGPRLRRVLSVRGTRDTPPLLQDQLVPDLVAFTDLVVHVERGGPFCTPCTEANGVFNCTAEFFGPCFLTSNAEVQANASYAKAVTFFPNPNLNADGSFSTAVPLPGGGTGDAVRGETVFDRLACATCHPAPLFTIDEFRAFTGGGLTLGQPRRMRDTSTPVLIPLRRKCQDASRPTGVDGSAGFGVPGLRGIWDTFPLLVSGAAGLQAVGPEPAFTSPCTAGSSGCCTQLQSPLNPGGTPVPEQHLAVSTKDPLRALLTAPLAVAGTAHGRALGLPDGDLDALIAYLRSL